MLVELHPLDGYFLDGVPSKGDAIRAALRTRSSDPRAQPFYRALDAVGERAADEALLALRLVLGGVGATDERVIAARAALRMARGGDARARADYLREVGTIADHDGTD
jgi:hypothetical protein